MRPTSLLATAGSFIPARLSRAITANIGVIYYALDRVNNPQGDSFEIYYGLGAGRQLVQI